MLSIFYEALCFDVLGARKTLLWLLTVLTGILTFDSCRGIIAQNTFFKNQKSLESTHQKANSTLLRDVLEIINTTTSTKTITIESITATMIFYVPLLLNATKFVEATSEIMTLTVVLTFFSSGRSNRIYNHIKKAKPTVFNK